MKTLILLFTLLVPTITLAAATGESEYAKNCCGDPPCCDDCPMKNHAK